MNSGRNFIVALNPLLYPNEIAHHNKPGRLKWTVLQLFTADPACNTEKYLQTSATFPSP